jgi:hypothetical protein
MKIYHPGSSIVCVDSFDEFCYVLLISVSGFAHQHKMKDCSGKCLFEGSLRDYTITISNPGCRYMWVKLMHSTWEQFVIQSEVSNEDT